MVYINGVQSVNFRKLIGINESFVNILRAFWEYDISIKTGIYHFPYYRFLFFISQSEYPANISGDHTCSDFRRLHLHRFPATCTCTEYPVTCTCAEYLHAQNIRRLHLHRISPPLLHMLHRRCRISPTTAYGCSISPTIAYSVNKKIETI